MTNLSQRDPRWASLPLGNSSVNIGGFGCTITSLAMYLGTTPDVVNTRLKAVNGFAQGNLVIWSKIKEAFPGVVIEEPYFRSYDNAAVLNNLPCLVEVDFDGTDRVDNRHWVLYIGNQQMLDPWTGNVEPTSKYSPISFRAIKGSWNREEIVAPQKAEDYFELDGQKLNYADRPSMFEAFKVWVAYSNKKLIDSANAITPDMFKTQVDATQSCQTQLQKALEQNEKDQDAILRLQDENKKLKSEYEKERDMVIDLKREIEATNKQDADYAEKFREADKLNDEYEKNLDMIAESANLEGRHEIKDSKELAKLVADKVISIQEENVTLYKKIDEASPSQTTQTTAGESLTMSTGDPITRDPRFNDDREGSNIFTTVWRLFFQ